jgi:uracil-DNA glycosylase
VDAAGLCALDREVVECRRCPRLVQWREQVARERRAAYASEEYWGRPLPGFGDREARVLVLGLAPAAHGGNRTGRIFTGDRSGDWLFASLYRTGYANQPISVSRDDGLALRGGYITAAVRCAPPANKPTPEQRARCFPFLRDEFAALTNARVVVTLGKIADDSAHALIKEIGAYRTARAPFAHLAETVVDLPGRPGVTVLASYHPSRQNTNTGVLTEEMLDAVFTRARALVI